MHVGSRLSVGCTVTLHDLPQLPGVNVGSLCFLSSHFECIWHNEMSEMVSLCLLVWRWFDLLWGSAGFPPPFPPTWVTWEDFEPVIPKWALESLPLSNWFWSHAGPVVMSLWKNMWWANHLNQIFTCAFSSHLTMLCIDDVGELSNSPRPLSMRRSVRLSQDQDRKCKKWN